MRIFIFLAVIVFSFVQADILSDRAALAYRQQQVQQKNHGQQLRSKADHAFFQNLKRFASRHGGIQQIISCQDRTDLGEPGNQGSIATRQVCDGDLCLPVMGLVTNDEFHQGIFSCRILFNDGLACSGSFMGLNYEKFGGNCYAADGKSVWSAVGTGRKAK